LAPFRCWISVSDCAIVQQVPTLERVPGVWRSQDPDWGFG
jgi:hypothetical protein